MTQDTVIVTDAASADKLIFFLAQAFATDGFSGSAMDGPRWRACMFPDICYNERVAMNGAHLCAVEFGKDD